MKAAARADWVGGLEEVKALVRSHRDKLLGDQAFLAELGVRLDAANVVDFGPAALSRAAAAHAREASHRKRLEAVSRANFAAQTRTHASVIDLIEAVDHPDLARRVEMVARLQFGLLTAILALEGEQGAPDGWRTLAAGQVEMLLGRRRVRLGPAPTAGGLFGDLAPIVGSAALVRISIGGRSGVMAFAAAEANAFASDMGAELITFLGRVVERTAERWPADLHDCG